MSYTERYSTRVHYSGTQSVPYPASDRAGHVTAYYEGDVPIEIRVTVNTDPFDASVRGATTALGVVAGAIGATEAAQIAQIQASAEDISHAAIHGFYSMLASELSSEASEFSSSMKSTTGHIVQLGSDLAHVHEQMESDYHAIHARYSRLFVELDRELDRRVRELDAPAFSMSDEAMRGVVQTPYQGSVARALLQTVDQSAVSLKLMCARVKSLASDALSTLGNMCAYLTSYSNAVECVTESSVDEGLTFAPVVYAVQEDITTGQRHTIVCQSPAANDDEVRKCVAEHVSRTPQDAWQQPTAQDREAIHKRFLERLQAYSSSVSSGDQGSMELHNRVCSKIMELYGQANTSTAYRA